MRELGAAESDLDKRFDGDPDRRQAFQTLEKLLVKDLRQRLKTFREIHFRPGLCRLESKLVERLVEQGFAQVATPLIMSKGLLARMSIDATHALNSQIYWLDGNRCLRPMLAPNLYFVLKDLLRFWDRPVRIFEVGPCFRKETRGAQHSNEFTMLNLVEMGLPDETRDARIRELGTMIVEAAGIDDYAFETAYSEVYGETMDIVAGSDRVEVGSSAKGPHPLDQAWKIAESWVGIGFGLERLLMVAGGGGNLAKVGRSLAYLDGVRLNI